jgi:glutathionylspermidine synthase
MQRRSCEPRHDWQAIVESQGFHFHTLDEHGTRIPYWDESAYYSFTSREIDLLEQASYALNGSCLKAVQRVIDDDLFDAFQIPPVFRDYIRASWEKYEHTVYGRFDFCFDGTGQPKLLEYNADTPTALLEAAVVQWYWFKDRFPTRDQFNSIHERLIEIWSILKNETKDLWYFTSLRDHLEDYMTVNYLRDTAIQAGLDTEYIAIEEIGWNSRLQAFVDMAERPMRHIFKLYPWEWMLKERFGPNLLRTRTLWLEAPWKMLLSNKAILPVLYEMFPDSPYLLKASWEPFGTMYVRKPILGREGANILIMRDGQVIAETGGIYSDNPRIYQELGSVPHFDGNYPIIGSWMVNGYACGIGIREDTNLITQNTSRFVPHIIESPLDSGPIWSNSLA